MISFFCSVIYVCCLFPVLYDSYIFKVRTTVNTGSMLFRRNIANRNTFAIKRYIIFWLRFPRRLCLIGFDGHVSVPDGNFQRMRACQGRQQDSARECQQ